MAIFALLMLGAVGRAGNDAANSPPERQERTRGADVEARYKLRDSDPHAMADAVAACEEQIRFASEPGADESDRKHRHTASE